MQGVIRYKSWRLDFGLLFKPRLRKFGAEKYYNSVTSPYSILDAHLTMRDGSSSFYTRAVDSETIATHQLERAMYSLRVGPDAQTHIKLRSNGPALWKGVSTRIS